MKKKLEPLRFVNFKDQFCNFKEGYAYVRADTSYTEIDIVAGEFEHGRDFHTMAHGYWLYAYSGVLNRRIRPKENTKKLKELLMSLFLAREPGFIEVRDEDV